MFHGYKTHTHTHTHTSLFTISVHLNPYVCMCVCLWGKETDFPFWNLNIPIFSLPLFVQPPWLIYLSLPSQTRQRSPRLWSRLPPRCVHTPRPLWTLVLSLSLSSSLNLKPLLHLCFSSPLVLRAWHRGSGDVWLNVLCPLWRHQLLFCVTAPEVCLWSPRLLVKMHLMAFALSFIGSLSSLCAATDIKGDS